MADFIHFIIVCSSMVYDIVFFFVYNVDYGCMFYFHYNVDYVSAFYFNCNVDYVFVCLMK